jgi:hypothetical protein
MGEGEVWEEVYANQAEEEEDNSPTGGASGNKQTDTETEGDGSAQQKRASQIFKRITQISRRNSNFNANFATSMQAPMQRKVSGKNIH